MRSRMRDRMVNHAAVPPNPIPNDLRRLAANPTTASPPTTIIQVSGSGTGVT